MKIEEIIAKYNYPDTLGNLLRDIYPSLVSYFGDEDLIYNALLDTPIVLCANVYECLVQNNMIDINDKSTVNVENLKQAGGVYCSKPDIKYKGLEKKYTIENVKRIIAINASTFDFVATKSTLIHEICHLIKSYYTEFTIKTDTLVERSGLITSTYHLNNQKGIVKRTLVFETGVGLEEGFNTVVQDEIAEKHFGKDALSIGYGLVKALSEDVKRYDDNMLNEIIKAELYHDNSSLEKLMGEGYFKLIDFADKLYKLNLEVMNFNLTDEERKAKAEEIKNFVSNNYLAIKTEIKTKSDLARGE